MNDPITERTRKILSELPPHVLASAAAKKRTTREVEAAIEGGIGIIAHNYVQEAEKMLPSIGRKVKWHLIGNLQKNKVKKAIRVFDMIETIDSLALCEAIEKQCAKESAFMAVLIQVNIAGEKTKNGISPGETGKFVEELSAFEHLKPEGLMTIEPYSIDKEESRKYFAGMKSLFEDIKRRSPAGAGFKYLSMGMSGSYKLAIEEGANLVRIGTKIFGERG